MLWYIIPFVVISMSTGAIALIFFRHVKALRSLDLDAMKIHRVQEQKYRVMELRLKRKYEEIKNVLRKWLQPLFHFLRAQSVKIQQSIHRERMLRAGSESASQSVALLLQDAKELCAKGEWSQAEEKYISIVTLDKDNLDAYWGLSNVYLAKKDYVHAEETVLFVSKMLPKDSAPFLELARISAVQEKYKDALDYARKAVDIAPNNPKNLDTLLELGILSKEKYLAMRTYDKLKEVNPENQKLADYEKRIAEL